MRHPARPRRPRGHAHRRRQVAVLSTAGTASPRRVHRDIAADRVDAGPGTPADGSTHVHQLLSNSGRRLPLTPSFPASHSKILPRVHASRGISALVVDEGIAFRIRLRLPPEYRQIHRLRTRFPQVQSPSPPRPRSASGRTSWSSSRCASGAFMSRVSIAPTCTTPCARRRGQRTRNWPSRRAAAPARASSTACRASASMSWPRNCKAMASWRCRITRPTQLRVATTRRRSSAMTRR